MESLGIKRCSKCGEEYLLEEFYKRSDRKDAPVSQCKWCCKDSVKQRQRKMRAKRREDYKLGKIQPIAEKWCKLCDEVLPWQDFYIRYDCSDLLSHYCRKCHNSDNLAYRRRTGYKRKNARNS